MAAFRRATIDAISGTKKCLRAGEDDDKIEQLFDVDCSDLEIDETSEDEGDFDIPEVQQGLEETEDRGEFLDEEDSDGEPLTVVQERLLAERVPSGTN
ncbi:hypothetical protein JTB14_021668 [Gonioctena quinquepunctata]|nr:hypothetical protein JTB14_021668 [Gonioctena quinquepunctata]